MAKSVDDGLKANDSAGMKFLRPGSTPRSRLQIAGSSGEQLSEECDRWCARGHGADNGPRRDLRGAHSRECRHRAGHFARSAQAGSQRRPTAKCAESNGLDWGIVRSSLHVCRRDRWLLSRNRCFPAAMAAAGITYYFGGTPVQIIGAASICLMNTLGLVCDPVGGEVEIPCHARNIAGVGHALSAATAALSGFDAVIPFDELVDQTVKVGKLMHPDLRCTARGGCAATATAASLVRRGGRSADI